MNKKFNVIGLIGHPRYKNALNTHKNILSWLINNQYNIILEKDIANELEMEQSIPIGSIEEIGEHADLAIVVGGDGNMLRAARVLANHDIKVIGVNRGNLGFLTDLDPDTAIQQLTAVLQGNYFVEQRFLLDVKIGHARQYHLTSTAVNEVVLHSEQIAHMIEFEVYINDLFAFSQRSDGLIISTPTGSTAYSLSGGGPILAPSSNVISLLPMFPHTLSSRPIVIDSHSVIKLRFSADSQGIVASCDSQITLPISFGQEITIQRSNQHYQLIHTEDYNYFNTLSTKLGWLKKLF